MRKHFLYLFLILAFVSCVTEVEFNNPAFEGQKDNVFWRAVYSKATVDASGALEIKAFSGIETVTLKTVSKNPQTYFLGTGNSNTATCVINDTSGKITFSTGFGIGEGEIVIEEFDAVNNTVTGTFKFNAENIDNNPLAGPILNFQYGHFYKIPITVSTGNIATSIP